MFRVLNDDRYPHHSHVPIPHPLAITFLAIPCKPAISGVTPAVILLSVWLLKSQEYMLERQTELCKADDVPKIRFPPYMVIEKRLVDGIVMAGA